MKFCERCGSFMDRTPTGLRCPKCGEEVALDEIEVRREARPSAEPVYVVDKTDDKALRVAQRCPRCGNGEAFRSVLITQGEHAGVKQDRAVERFTCTACHHTWTKS